MSDLYLSQLWLNPRSRAAWHDLADCQGLHRTLLRAFPDGLLPPSPAAAGEGQGVGVIPTAYPRGARAACGLLFRPETDRRTGAVRILAQSTVIPDWRALPPGYVAPAPGCPDGWSTRLLPPTAWQVEAGARRRFRLRANVTAKVRAPRVPLAIEGVPNANGSRVPLRTEGAQLAWLLAHATAAGFRVTLPAPGDAVRDDHPEAPRLRALADAEPVAGLPPVRIDRDAPRHGWRPAGEGGGAGHAPRARLTFEGLTFEGLLEVDDPVRFAGAIRAGIGPAKAYGYGLLSVAPI